MRCILYWKSLSCILSCIYYLNRKKDAVHTESNEDVFKFQYRLSAFLCVCVPDLRFLKKNLSFILEQAGLLCKTSSHTEMSRLIAGASGHNVMLISVRGTTAAAHHQLLEFKALNLCGGAARCGSRGAYFRSDWASTLTLSQSLSGKLTFTANSSLSRNTVCLYTAMLPRFLFFSELSQSLHYCPLLDWASKCSNPSLHRLYPLSLGEESREHGRWQPGAIKIDIR